MRISSFQRQNLHELKSDFTADLVLTAAYFDPVDHNKMTIYHFYNYNGLPL